MYGYFALLTVTPFLCKLSSPNLQGFNALSAGLVLGVMITPMVASLSEDALYSVPRSLKDGAYALGATKRETVTSVILPAALSGIVSSLILAVSRAVGETMIVTLAAGANPTLGLNPLGSGDDHDLLYCSSHRWRCPSWHHRVQDHLCRRHDAFS